MIKYLMTLRLDKMCINFVWHATGQKSGWLESIKLAIILATHSNSQYNLSYIKITVTLSPRKKGKLKNCRM